MSSGTLPTVLLIPGALTTPACYDLLLPHLQQAGLSVHIAALPSSNPPNPDEHSAATDGEYLLDQYLLPLVNDGKDVIVFAHSFSATCLSGAGRRLSKAERIAKGLRGGVVGLIYISFAMVPEGQSQFEYLGNIWPAFVRLDHPSPGLMVFDPVIETLFNDAEPERQEEFAMNHTPHSVNVFKTPVSAPLWTDAAFEDRRILIKTLLDATFPPHAQQMFADNCGVDWNIVQVAGGHETFMTKPVDVAEVIIDSAQMWQHL